MSDAKMKKAFALKTFKDAGTEQMFAGGEVHDIETGAYANYEAAGLVRAATADEGKTAGADTKSKPAG